MVSSCNGPRVCKPTDLLQTVVISGAHGRPFSSISSRRRERSLCYARAVLGAALLVLSAVVAAWFPPETVPWAGVVLAVVALTLVPDAWGRTSRAGLVRVAAFTVPLAVWISLGLLTGLGRAQGLGEAALAVGVAGFIWLASRRCPGERQVAVVVGGIALLAVWAVWQVGHGFEVDLGAVGLLPEAIRATARQRLLLGRAFASQTQPGHLAVLLATVVPIALSRLVKGHRRWPWAGALLLCWIGIALTRSLLGAGLAAAGAVAVGARLRRREAWLAAAGMVVVLVTLVALRGDLIGRLEPVRLRLENWHSALWVWRTAPVTGVGLGGFGQAALAAPFATANHPQHAHALPLEWAAELGGPGILLAGAFYLWLFRLARDTFRLDPGLATATLMVPIHGLLDFSIYMWGVAIPWAILAGWAWGLRRHAEGERVVCPQWLRPLAVAAAGLAVAVAVLNLTGATLERAAAGAPPPDALRFASQARRLAPWRFQAVRTLADLAASGGPDSVAAAAELDRARWWKRRSPALELARAVAAAGAGDVPGEARAAWAASWYAPRGSGLRQAARGLLKGVGAPR